MKLLVLTLIVFSIYFFACGATQMLTSTDTNWNPYRANQTLRFKNKKGEEKKLKIVKIHRSSDRSNPYGGALSGTNEQMVVLFKDAKQGGQENLLFALGKNSDGSTSVNFHLAFAKVVNDSHAYKMNEVNRWPVKSHSIGKKNYKDVVSFKPFNNPQNTDIFPSAKKVYWSKSKGYIRYELSNGEVWELVE